MRRLLLTIVLTLSFAAVSQAQTTGSRKSEWQVDKFRPTFGLMMGVVPLRYSMLQDQGSGVYTYLDSREVTKHPVYAIQDTAGYLYSTTVNLGLNIPFYRTDNWSVGTKINAGVGGHGNLIAARGLESLVFDFPQFLYYQNYKGKVYYTVLAGYKYTMAALSHHQALAGIEVKVNSVASIRLHSSLNSYKYYNLYSDGRLEPAIEIRDFGLTIVRYL